LWRGRWRVSVEFLSQLLGAKGFDSVVTAIKAVGARQAEAHRQVLVEVLPDLAKNQRDMGWANM